MGSTPISRLLELPGVLKNTVLELEGTFEHPPFQVLYSRDISPAQ